MKNNLLKFPDNFLWGASTSAHQVEGNNLNDWSQWEKLNCEKLASEAKAAYFSENRYPTPSSYWKKVRKRAENPSNYISGIACDHYTRFPHDFDLAKKLNHSAHRFSIEWARIEPEEGKFDHKEIEHYRDVISCLKDHGMEPFVTLWHFSVPVWFRDRGGWKAKDSVKYYSRYVTKVVESFKSEVVYWITINEPMVFSASSFLFARFPAEEKSLFAFLRVIGNLIKAHRSAYEIIKKSCPDGKVGIAKNIIHFEAYRNRASNLLLKKSLDSLWNNYFLNRIDSHQDFIGLNHYFHKRINFGINKNEDEVFSDMGWELYPESIYHSLKDLQKYRKPIYITENGLADADDSRRAWYIREILKNIHRAIREGLDVKGYLHWSLLDNFEWHKGFWPKFGLLEVDRYSMQRRVRDSALEYADIAANNGLSATEE
jgi:beta-glucosidase